MNAGGVRQRSVEIVVPVYNEAHVLADSVGRLHAYLEAAFPFPFRVTIADNASTDATWETALALTDRLPHVHAVHLDAKGRGRALKHVWSRSTADVVAYMDVDLSTGLEGFLPLVAPLLSGHSDLAIGSRLHRQADIVRGPRREFVSRSYNLLLKLGLAARFSDAQCGFKAVRTDVFRALAPHIQDTAWFFDTELLVLAQRNGLRIHEVPVDWVDDPDSRVDIVRTALDDLKGMGRMLRATVDRRILVADVPRRVRRGWVTTPTARTASRTAASTASRTTPGTTARTTLGTAPRTPPGTAPATAAPVTATTPARLPQGLKDMEYAS
ncbi:glycosyltransferase, group 2 family protein [Streptomyces ipomoeae 91-03]|jgi:glycosyltransferase involved in cell wall biosynthesis|uniref:dolichyl-phosphate beta-glucosyltransferase n=2 Tax=Streptomyces ipomoeae TaxID=103232 RepID=L1KJW9_9ACTN|nr:glycosyltransferase, group 2 family protein [Streptomyces ipomoeae 91-03]